MSYEENREHCKSIAEDLENCVNGGYFYYDGDIFPYFDTNPEYWNKEEQFKYNEEEDTYTIYNEELEADDLEAWDLYKYFEDDIKFTINSDLSYSGVCLMVTCGGPNIYIDTNSKQVELHWGGDNANYPLNYDVVQAIDEYWEEYYNCIR